MRSRSASSESFLTVTRLPVALRSETNALSMIVVVVTELVAAQLPSAARPRQSVFSLMPSANEPPPPPPIPPPPPPPLDTAMELFVVLITSSVESWENVALRPSCETWPTVSAGGLRELIVAAVAIVPATRRSPAIPASERRPQRRGAAPAAATSSTIVDRSTSGSG